MNAASLLIAATALVVAGCAGTKDQTNLLLNPPGIHASADAASDAAGAGQVPVTQYYAAMKAAQDKSAGTAEIAAMVDKGIGLVGAYCLRWFQKVDDAQRRLDLQEKDYNIIRQLGTALLGVGKASSSIVATYGAANTAYSGIVENFNGAILAGPATAKVKVQVLDMLKQSETKLRADTASLTFAQAYNRIELHADTCTYSTVRNMLDSSLASTKSHRDPETGKITSERVESTYQFDDNSGKLQNFWKPKGMVDNANQAAITQYLTQNGVTGISIVYFINTPEFASLRAKAVKDLKL
jgi:hypothetical protein